MTCGQEAKLVKRTMEKHGQIHTKYFRQKNGEDTLICDHQIVEAFPPENTEEGKG